ncbi:hypothetical protein GQ54DRAFT_314969, partial [Martensiomyces pterosporus]
YHIPSNLREPGLTNRESDGDNDQDGGIGTSVEAFAAEQRAHTASTARNNYGRTQYSNPVIEAHRELMFYKASRAWHRVLGIIPGS